MSTHHPLRRGIGFGLTSGVITTLGLIVGLYSGTHSRIAVIGGILTIAIADALSDAFGMHISEEAAADYSTKEIWQSSFVTFLSKFIFALTFAIPIIIFSLTTAVILCILWGVILIAVFSYIIAKQQHHNPWKMISEHIVTTFIVILLTYYVGEWIRSTFI